LIAGRLPGRTSNDVKNYWHTHLQKKMVCRKLEEEKREKDKPKETIKAHVVFKPQPRTFSTHSLWLNGKHNNIATPVAVVSTKDDNAPRDHDVDKETTVSNQIGNVDASQPSLGNAPIPCEMWWDSLLNLGEQEGSKKFGSCSLLQEENFILDFPNVDENDSIWDSNLCDFNSLWDL
jgi:hypothetical protein